VVGITQTLVERLMKRYPSAIAGMKDSSGDWSNTKTMLDAFAASGFDVFPGSESFLLAGMRHGAAGCISATANVNPAAIDRLYREWRGADADQQQEALNVVRKTVGQYIMLPGLKQVIAHYASDPEWVTVRPPLTELTATQAKQVMEGLHSLGFSMPGIEHAAV
jgi:4-hydroxy-tetrahydrodipicolinate synthase